MRRSHVLFLLLVLKMPFGFNPVACGQQPDFTVESLETEGQMNPLGIDVAAPHFQWKFANTGEPRGLTQQSYRILVATTSGLLSQNRGDVWDSGEVRSATTLNIPYVGEPLVSHRRYFWKVGVKMTGNPPVWSEPGQFVTGMLDPGEWKAKWIAGSQPYRQGSPLPIFRREFSLQKPVASAFVMVSGLGQYELLVNGNPVTDTVLNPAWTNYRKTVFYNTFDVTRQMQQGANVFGVLLGNGMYNVEKTPGRYTKFTGSFGEPKVIL